MLSAKKQSIKRLSNDKICVVCILQDKLQQIITKFNVLQLQIVKSHSSLNDLLYNMAHINQYYSNLKDF